MDTITNTVKLFSESGVDSLITLKRNINSDNTRRKSDGGPKHIIEIACSPALKGHLRWTLRLLEEQAKAVMSFGGF